MLKKLFIKFFPNGSGYSPIKVKIFGFITVVVIFSVSTGIFLSVSNASVNEKYETFKYLSIFLLVIIIYSSLIDYYGKKRHQNILYSKKISALKSVYKFDIENLNNGNYWGYKGLYEEYFFRIYYDWSAGLKKTGTRFCIMLHYKPLMIANDIVDCERMNSLTNKYNQGNNYEVKFNTSYLIIYMRYNFLTSFEEFKEKFDLAVKIAQEENLAPNTERDVGSLLLDKELQLLHAPEIDTFYE